MLFFQCLVLLEGVVAQSNSLEDEEHSPVEAIFQPSVSATCRAGIMTIRLVTCFFLYVFGFIFISLLRSLFLGWLSLFFLCFFLFRFLLAIHLSLFLFFLFFCIFDLFKSVLHSIRFLAWLFVAFASNYPDLSRKY